MLDDVEKESESLKDELKQQIAKRLNANDDLAMTPNCNDNESSFALFRGVLC